MSRSDQLLDKIAKDHMKEWDLRKFKTSHPRLYQVIMQFAKEYRVDTSANQVGGEKMRELARMIDKQILGLGFCLLTFEFHNAGIANYIANAQREDMIKALREMADRLESKQDFNTPNQN